MSPTVHPTAIIEAGVDIGAGTRIWDGVHVRANAKIGRDCIIGEKTYVAYDVHIGDLVKINAHVYICAGVTLSDGCMVGAHTVFTNDKTPRATDPGITTLHPSEPDGSTERSSVGRGATIGANATIGPGVQLGDYSMVGMGTVVTRSCPPHGLIMGNPGRLVGLVARDGTRVLSIPSGEELPTAGRIECPGDGFLSIENGTVVHQES